MDLNGGIREEMNSTEAGIRIAGVLIVNRILMAVNTGMIMVIQEDVRKDKADTVDNKGTVDNNMVTFLTVTGDHRDQHTIMTGNNMETLMEVAEASHMMNMITVWEIIWAIGVLPVMNAIAVILMTGIHKALLTVMMI